MKNFWKRIAIILTLVMTLAFIGCDDKDETQKKCVHSWELLSNTATCSEKGIKTYECAKCNETKTEDAPLVNHKFVGTKCSVCSATAKNTWSPKSECTKCSNVNIISDNQTYYTKLSTTVTCLNDGAAYYKCSKCYNDFYVLEKALGHDYNKNVCTRCKEKLNNLSQFPKTYRNEIAENLLLVAPYTVDSETWGASSYLLKLQFDEIKTCENNVTKAQTAYDNACNEATVRRFNPATNQWEWGVDEKKVAATKSALTNAENDLKQAKADLNIYEASYKFNCEGYAWNIAILGIKANDASNYAVNYNLAYLMANEMTALDTTTTPTWYNDIVSSIKTLTGINIKES